MARFVELVERNPAADQRFRKSTMPLGMSIGVRRVREINQHKPMLWVYDMGEPERLLTQREMRALYVDIDDDWTLSNA
jgi:hypothetical protein